MTGMILIWMLRKQDMGVFIGFIWLRMGSSKHGNKPSDSIKCGEFLD